MLRTPWCYWGFCSNAEFDGMFSKPTLTLEDGAKFMNSFNKSVKREANEKRLRSSRTLSTPRAGF